MGYEIYETRIVNRDGRAVVKEGAIPHWEAYVWGHDGLMTYSLVAANEITFNIKAEGDEGGCRVPLKDHLAAVSALRRIAGMDAPLDPAVEVVRERAATVVERACDILKGGGDVGETAASDLRVTMLQLIDLATRRDDVTGGLESDAKPPAREL